MLIIELAKQPVQNEHSSPGECPRCGCLGWHKWGSPKVRNIIDASVGEVSTQRYRRKGCGKTITARIKPRYRTTRGLKTDAGAINFRSVVCDVLN